MTAQTEPPKFVRNQLPSEWADLIEVRRSVDDPIKENLSSLIFGRGGGTSKSMSAITREEIDAKLDAATARTERAFADMKSEISAMRGDFKASFASVPSKGFIAVTAVAIVGAVIGAMAFGASQFGNGVMVTSTAVQDSVEAKRIAQENAAEVRALRQDLSTFIADIKQMPQWKSPPPQQ